MTTKTERNKFNYNNRLFRIDITEIDPLTKEKFTNEWKNRKIKPGQLFNEIWIAYEKFKNPADETKKELTQEEKDILLYAITEFTKSYKSISLYKEELGSIINKLELD